MKRRLHTPAPLLPLALCMAVGIAMGSPLSAGWTMGVLAAMVVASLLAGRWPIVQSIGIWLCFLILGMAAAPGEEEQLPDGVWTEAVIASLPTEKPKTVMTTLLLPSSGEQRRCYIWKDSASLRLMPGDELMVSIHNRQFIGRNDWQRGGDGFNRLSSLQRLKVRALQWRSKPLQRFRDLGDDDDSEAQALLAAMVLGDKSGLTSGLRERFNVTGAAHILALSGLHLGIIYMLLLRLTMGRRRAWLPQLLTLTAIWAFALLTGLSVSVVRAAVMLTIYTLMGLGGRSHATLNVLSLTAIIMLLADSRALFDVGFQLSFMSMLGILLFTPLFESFLSVSWRMRHPVVNSLFGLTTVSLAAQLGTAPLVAYYFSRFATYFLLVNIVIVPMAMLIIYASLVTLMVPVAGGVLLWLVGALNTILGWVADMPMASIGDLHPSMLQVALMYVVVGAVYGLLTISLRSRDYT